jgi:hypothetical protein
VSEDGRPLPDLKNATPEQIHPSTGNISEPQTAHGEQARYERPEPAPRLVVSREDSPGSSVDGEHLSLDVERELGLIPRGQRASSNDSDSSRRRSVSAPEDQHSAKRDAEDIPADSSEPRMTKRLKPDDDQVRSHAPAEPNGSMPMSVSSTTVTPVSALQPPMTSSSLSISPVSPAGPLPSYQPDLDGMPLSPTFSTKEQLPDARPPSGLEPQSSFSTATSYPEYSHEDPPTSEAVGGNADAYRTNGERRGPPHEKRHYDERRGPDERRARQHHYDDRRHHDTRRPESDWRYADTRRDDDTRRLPDRTQRDEGFHSHASSRRDSFRSDHSFRAQRARSPLPPREDSTSPRCAAPVDIPAHSPYIRPPPAYPPGRRPPSPPAEDTTRSSKHFVPLPRSTDVDSTEGRSRRPSFYDSRRPTVPPPINARFDGQRFVLLCVCSSESPSLTHSPPRLKWSARSSFVCCYPQRQPPLASTTRSLWCLSSRAILP